jgi:hypothetical protein
VTEDQSNAALAAMTEQREQELAGVEAHYKLRKACTARAVELFDLLQKVWTAPAMRITVPEIGVLINEIKDDAK